MASTRQSSFELLRILAMLAIIAGHFCRKTDILSSVPVGISGLATTCCGSGLCIAVNLFLLLAMWFLVGAQFNAKRIMSLYLQALVFAAPPSIVLFCCGLFNDPLAIFLSFLPIFGVSAWFATDFILFLLLAPFLSQAFHLSNRSLRLLLGILLSIFCFGPTFFKNFGDSSFLGGLMWFATVYYFVGTMKRERWLERIDQPVLCLLGAGILYFTLCLGRTSNPNGYPEYYLTTANTLPNFLCAFLVFAFATKKQQWHSQTINILAMPTFAVYVFHDAPAVRSVQWRLCRQGLNGLISAGVPVCVGILGIACMIFLVYSLLGLFYKRFIEPYLIRSRAFQIAEARLQDLYRGIDQRSVNALPDIARQ